MTAPPRIYLSPPHLTGEEGERLTEVLRSNWVAPAGPELDLFEGALAAEVGTRHALALCSGTAALHLALRCLPLRPGDEVLCSTLTFCASANPIVYEGANPVFVDSDVSTWNLDPNLVEDELRACARRGKTPRAIVAVDLFGQSVDRDALTEVADRFGVPIVEDAAEALGARYKGQPVGSGVWASVFSFNGNKILTAGGGGALCSDDERLISAARHLATQARDPAPHYEHSRIGFNYRMSNVLAGIGVAQLAALDRRVEARRSNFRFYQQALGSLPGVSFMPEAAHGHSNRWLTVMQIDAERFGATPEQVRVRLEEHNIESRPVWKPLHLQPVFRDARRRGGAVAERLFRNGLCLPSGSSLTTADLRHVCDAVTACCRPPRAIAA